MNLLKIVDIEFYYLLFLRRVFGKKVKNLDLVDFRKNMATLEPLFILSTGRCGTKWIDELLKSDSSIISIHHIHPVMRSQAKLVYELNYPESTSREQMLMKEMFLGGREEVFLQGMKVDKNIVFTDSRMTFFAEVIYDLFPKAKFVHLHRHPGGVVSSGVNRGWYTSNSQSELNRIYPGKNNAYYTKWSEMDRIEKNAWLWSETNRWILDFLKKVPAEQKFDLSFDNWSPESIQAFCRFCGVEKSTNEIASRMKKKVNKQQKKELGHYKTWPKEDQEKLATLTADISKLLSYSL